MNNSYLYTETAFHHEGDINYIKKLIASSSTSGVDGIKFQVLTKPSDFISSKHSSFVTLGKYCFSLKEWEDIFEYTLNKGLDIIMMPLNLESFQLLNKFKVKYLDIHSVSFYDTILLEEIKKTELNIILGVGGRKLEEIKEKELFFKEKLKVLMVGFQSFPSKLEKVKIGKIKYLKEFFPRLEIGYADHSSYDNEFAVLSNDYARLLGATFFEKHITIAEGVERVDAASAVGTEKITAVKKRIDFIEKYVLTNEQDSFIFDKTETVYRNRQLRCVVNKDILTDSILQAHDISLKMVDNQEEFYSRVEDVIGRKIKVNLSFDQAISKEVFYE
jgi:N,N'-diacetyllegionaminate synthase